MGVMQQDEDLTDAPITNGLQLWLDAADSSTLFDSTTGGSTPANNGAVARWEDKSGNANHATQTIANERPLRITNDTNGNDVVLFDGVNDWFSLASSIDLSLTGNLTTFAVHKRNSSGIVNTDLNDLDSPQRYAIFWWINDKITHANGNLSKRIKSSSSIDTGVFLLEAQNHRSKADPTKLFRNGTEIQKGDVGDATGSYESIGKRAFSSGLFTEGEICEITHYNQELTTQEITDERNRLANKWGVALV